jgi:hypothetical protein
MVKQRNPALVLLLWIVTLGIYGIYWIVVTKHEMCEKGAKIPPAWLVVIPIINLYFLYKYCKGISQLAMKDEYPWLWFLLWLLFWPVAVVLFQIGLNGIASPEAVEEKKSKEIGKKDPLEHTPKPSS